MNECTIVNVNSQTHQGYQEVTQAPMARSQQHQTAGQAATVTIEYQEAGYHPRHEARSRLDLPGPGTQKCEHTPQRPT